MEIDHEIVSMIILLLPLIVVVRINDHINMMIAVDWGVKVVRDPCQKITLLLLKSKSVRVIVPESCF